jgi:uncharacterized protein (DUF427 family)
MNMRATVDGVILAEAPKDQLISIEGNWYFPPDCVNFALLEKSATPYHCAWKGDCQYFSVKIGDNVLKDRAWSYPAPYPGAITRVGKDFSNYVAFWKEVMIGD